MLSFALSATVLMSMSQIVMANTTAEKVVRTDRIAFYKPAATQPAAKVKRVQRTDRIVYNVPVVEQPSLQQKRIARTDRVVFYKSE